MIKIVLEDSYNNIEANLHDSAESKQASFEIYDPSDKVILLELMPPEDNESIINLAARLIYDFHPDNSLCEAMAKEHGLNVSIDDNKKLWKFENARLVLPISPEDALILSSWLKSAAESLIDQQL